MFLIVKYILSKGGSYYLSRPSDNRVKSANWPDFSLHVALVRTLSIKLCGSTMPVCFCVSDRYIQYLVQALIIKSGAKEYKPSKLIHIYPLSPDYLLSCQPWSASSHENQCWPLKVLDKVQHSITCPEICLAQETRFDDLHMGKYIDVEQTKT
jgi:hypothetical protein